MKQATFIILGITGDLSKRKLIPAIYRLVDGKKIDKFSIIGVAIENSDIVSILNSSKSFIKNVDKKTWDRIESCSYYFKLDFYNDGGYKSLGKLIKDVEKKHKLVGNRIFYMASLPEHFAVITKNLSENKIVEKHDSKRGCVDCKHPWARIVYEKPFGWDLKSARRINRCVHKLFHEKQIYQIDHFLGKDLVSNISIVRFTNRIFEPLWNNKNIEFIQIILDEKIGIGRRGGFYDKYGAIKDVVQNHMLQILSLVAMEPPAKLEAKFIRDAKAKVLKKTKVDSCIIGQYEGYLEEKDVDPNSKTETFAALKLSIDNKRWRGVSFYLKTGKFLDKKDTSIHIKFKMVDCLLTKNCPTDSNYLTIRITPNEGFYLEMNTKVPGTENEILPVKMNFCHTCLFGPNTPEAYEVLLTDVLCGDQSAFIRSDEIEYSWKIVEQVDKDKLKLYNYRKGSKGPKELELLDKNKKIRWRA